MSEVPFIILSQLREDCTTSAQSTPPSVSLQKPGGSKLFKSQKPQISTIPGISPKVRNRYQVMLGDEILGTNLSIDEALKLARGGVR